MSGIGGISGPGGTGGIIGPIPPPSSPLPSSPPSIDSATTYTTTPSFLNLSASPIIELPSGQMSIIEVEKLISAALIGLRRNLNDAQVKDYYLFLNQNEDAAQQIQLLIKQYHDVVNQVHGWNTQVEAILAQANAAYLDLSKNYAGFDNLLRSLLAKDQAAIDPLNAAYSKINDPVQRQQLIDQFGSEDAALAWLNGVIANYNDYADNRLHVDMVWYQNKLKDDVITPTKNYNNLIDSLNSQIDAINQQRAQQGLPPANIQLKKTPVPNDDIDHYVKYNVPHQPIYSSLPTHINLVDYPTLSDLVLLPPPTPPGLIPNFDYVEALVKIWGPNALSTVLALFNIFTSLDALKAMIDAQNIYLGFNRAGANLTITFPKAFYSENKAKYFSSVDTSGGGAALATFALGLQSRKLEIVLSSALLRAIAINASTPISGRVFARLQFTAMELLLRSSLLSSIPAMRMMSSVLGHLGASSPAVSVGLSFAVIEQVVGLLQGGLVRQFVNAEINRLPSFARINLRAASKQASKAEAEFKSAVDAGDPERTDKALAGLVDARIKHGRATSLYNTLGTLSVGKVGYVTQQTAASLSLSLITASLANFGNAIGMPGIVPQLFAHVSGMPTTSLITAQTAGSNLMDVLDNPLNMAFIKKTLTDTLVNQMGATEASAIPLINTAINNVILKGSLSNVSQLQADLIDEFSKAGFSRLQAHRLANETTALIRGDLGALNSNVAFGFNLDPSFVASSIVNNIKSNDAGLAGSMLSSSGDRALLLGGFGSSTRLQNDLTDSYINLGLRVNDASTLAIRTQQLYQTVGTLVPLTQYPGVAGILMGDSLLRGIAFGTPVAKEELIKDLLNQGLNASQADEVARLVADLTAGKSVASDNLLSQALSNGITRALGRGPFETMGEFRDAVREELKGVGFKSSDINFLANSVAAFAVTGTPPAPSGIAASAVGALESAFVNSITAATSLSADKASATFSAALGNTSARGPFSTEDEFKAILKEEVDNGVLGATGTASPTVFDNAMAEVAGTGTILSLPDLAQQLGGSVLGMLRADLGPQLAQDVHDEILSAILGTTADEAEGRGNPLSVLNQANDQVQKLTSDEDQAELLRLMRKLAQLLAAIETPNFALGNLEHTLSQAPQALVNSVSLMGAPKKDITDIPA